MVAERKSGCLFVDVSRPLGIVVNERSFVSTSNKLSTQHNMY